MFFQCPELFVFFAVSRHSLWRRRMAIPVQSLELFSVTGIALAARVPMFGIIRGLFAPFALSCG